MRRRFHLLSNHRLESRVLLLFVALLAGAMILAKAASEIVEGDTMAVDRAIVLALRVPGDSALPIGPPWLTHAIIDLTALGSVAVLSLITCLATGYLLVERKPTIAAYMLAAVASGFVAGTLLKWVYARARPDIVTQLVGTHSASFPSGHAMNSAIVYLTLAVLLARSAQRRSVRIYLISAAISLTVLVGCTRIYLGVHWPTDVLAGWVVGGLWAVGCSLAAKQLQSRKSIEGAGTSP
jgi:undecaprenyl-diphosphatase